jgi:hypothetical protein
VATPRKRLQRKLARDKTYRAWLKEEAEKKLAKEEKERAQELRFTPEYELPRALRDMGLEGQSDGLELIEFEVKVGDDEPSRVTDKHLEKIGALVSENDLEEVKTKKTEEAKKELQEKSTRKRPAPKPARRRRPATTDEKN